MNKRHKSRDAAYEEFHTAIPASGAWTRRLPSQCPNLRFVVSEMLASRMGGLPLGDPVLMLRQQKESEEQDFLMLLPT